MDVLTVIKDIEIGLEIVAPLIGWAVVSEALPFSKKIKSNSAAQLIVNIFKTILALYRGDTRTFLQKEIKTPNKP